MNIEKEDGGFYNGKGGIKVGLTDEEYLKGIRIDPLVYESIVTQRDRTFADRLMKKMIDVDPMDFNMVIAETIIEETLKELKEESK